MRIRLILLVLMCGLLGACSNSVPTPAIPTATATSPAATFTLPPPPATPSPVIAVDPTSTTAEPDAPTPEPTLESILEPESTLEPTLEPENTVQPTLAVGYTPLPTSASRATAVTVPGGPLTVVALGDSLTEGDGDYPGDGGGYPARLQISINAVRPDSQVINLGKSGWDSQQMVDGQLQDALQANPNIALVWIGSNDLWYNNGPDNEAADVARYTTNIDKTLHDLTRKGARIYIALLDDQSKRPFATSPNGFGLDKDAAAYMSKLGGDFNSVISDKAAEYGATTVDFYNTTLFTDLATLADDGLHPNPKGYDLVAQIWLDVISPALQ